MLMRISELGCRALIEIVFESISVRRQVGYLTVAQQTESVDEILTRVECEKTHGLEKEVLECGFKSSVYLISLVVITQIEHSYLF